MTNVRIGDLVFHGGDGHDGFFIRGGGLEGLQDGVDSHRDSEDRPNADGVFPATTYLSPRVVAIGGDCEASSAEKLDYYSSKLKALHASRAEFTVVFDMPGKTLYGKAHFSDKPTFKPTIWGRLAEWDIELQFDDPRLYGETRTFGPVAAGAGLDVYHYGNFPASPKFTVAGTVANDFAVYGPGSGVTRKRYKVNGAVAPGAPNTIDLRTGYTYVNGSLRVGVVEDATNWVVPPGAKLNHMLDANGGAATLSVTVTDTYI